jgi:cell division protein FtsI/penicillin-binding protein 2
MIAAIGEGYLVRPCIIEREAIEQEHIEKQPLLISQKTRSFLLESMHQVVAQGSGQRLSRFANMEIYAKTGTAQTCALEKNILGGKYKDHAWFVCYVRYRDYEPLVLLVLLENSGLSTCSTHVAQQFLERYCSFVDKHAAQYRDHQLPRSLPEKS